MRMRRVFRRVFRAVVFLLVYVVELVMATATVAWEIVTPVHAIRPWIVRVPVSSRTDAEITGIANLVSFTPGTLTLEVTEDRTAIIVHALHVSDAERLRARIARLERRWLEVVR